MVMHILPAYYTTTKTSKKKKKTTKQISSHDIWLLKRGLHPEQIKNKKTVDENWKTSYTESMKVERKDYVSNGMVEGVGSKKEPKVYSGELKLLGIATMHKSNMVPIFSKENAEEISKMRRG